MATSVERVKELCKERHLPISRLEKDLGFANGYISQLRKGSFPADRLQKIADYFHVSTEFLLTGKNNRNDGYYFDAESAALAQNIFENPHLRLLLDAAKDATVEDIETTYDLLSLLKKRENNNNDD